MKIVLQRVLSASVSVNAERVAEINGGLLLLCGVGQNDNETTMQPMAEKIAQMRIFANDSGKFDYSVLDVKGAVLCVPQFTLFADTSKGRRPEFFSAMRPPEASRLFDLFVAEFQKLGIPTKAGIFGADMQVELINDGPVTITLEN